MASESDARSEIRDAVQQYLARYPEDAAAVEALRVQLLDDGDILHRSNMRGHVTTSALVLDRTLTHGLVIHHRVFDVWLQPGGHYEPPGSLWDSACREVAEETGLQVIRPYPAVDASPLPVDVDTHPIPARPAKGEAEHWHHDLAYLAVTDGRFVPTPQVDEVHAVRWVALDEIARYPNARLRRLAAKAARIIAAKRTP